MDMTPERLKVARVRNKCYRCAKQSPRLTTYMDKILGLKLDLCPRCAVRLGKLKGYKRI